MSQAVLSSQRVLPVQALASGFEFQFRTVENALKDLIPEGGDEVLEVKQWIPASMEDVFGFFSSAHNLERITPPWLNFQVLMPEGAPIEAGSLIDYRLKIRGMPAKWRTLIESWKPGEMFVDTQLRGPYRKWHHTHHFEKMGEGVLIEDRVLFRLPLGWLGRTVAGPWVKSDVEQIFDFRKNAIRDIFRK
jgi:ligand-binding SRPBCC domain-containing protein